jgi:hypothetical protein
MLLSAYEFWDIMGSYGARVWPAQVVFLVAAVLVMLLVFLKPGDMADTLIKLYLAVSCLWAGIVFFMILGKAIPGYYFFGILFIIVGILFAADLFRRRMAFRLPSLGWHRSLTVVLTLIVLCYPILSIVFGHHFPRVIVLGAFPCPTTALALVLLTIAVPRGDRILYIIFLFWAIPFPPFLQLTRWGVYEDTIMFGIGIYSLVLLVKSWQGKSTQSTEAST